MSVAPVPVGASSSGRTSQRRRAVIALYGLSAFWGVAQLVATENAMLYYLSAIAFATLATLWFSLDRRILGATNLPILALLFFFTWPVASLFHLLATRGLRGCGYWFVHAIGLFAAMCLTFFPAMLLLSWAGVFDLDTIADH